MIAYPFDTDDNGPEVMQNTPVLWLPQLEDNDMTVQKIQYVKPVLYTPESFLSKNKDTATGNAGQMIQNNSNMQHQALELSGVIEKMVKLPSGRNSIYGVDDLNTGMINASMLDCSIGGCASAQRMNMALKGNKSKHHTPSDRWFAAVLASADVGDTKDHFVKSAVRHLGQITRHRKKPKGGLTFAIDMHLIPRYDRKPGEELTRSRQKSGTTYFERYVSIQCVDKGMRLVMGFEPLGALGNTHDAVEQLLDTLLYNGIPVRLILFDRGFFSTNTLELLNRLHIPYLMPCVNTQGVTEALNEFAEFQRMGVSVNMLKGSGKKIPYILIITHRRNKDSPTEPKDRFVGFATNMPDIDLAEYDKRWGIETGYSMIEKIRACTRSRKMSSRVFCFAFTLMMYNVWVALNAVMAYCNTLVIYSHITLTALRMILLDIPSNVSSRSPKDGLQGNGGGDCAKPFAIA